MMDESTYEFVKKLSLVFEFSVFVDAYSRVRRLRGYEFEEGVDCDPLDELAVAFERLHLLVLALLNAP